MRKFKSPGQAQRFLTVHGLVRNFFRVGCVIRKKEDRVSTGKTDEIRCFRHQVLVAAA